MRALDLAFPSKTLSRGGRPEVRLRWLGTAGFELGCRGSVLLLDPYLTRAPLLRCLRGPLQPDAQIIGQHVSRADAIAVGHTHFDHALDVPAVAHATGATVLGSESAMALCRSAGILQRQLTPIVSADGAPTKEWVGPFDLDFFPGEHSPIAAGRIPFDGDISDTDALPLPVHRYRCGPVWRIQIRAAGRTIVHLGSAALPVGPPAQQPVDLLLLCATGWHTTPDFPERVIEQLAPRMVLLAHWDNFFRPLDRPAQQLPGLKLAELVRRLEAASPEVTIGTVAPLQELWL